MTKLTETDLQKGVEALKVAANKGNVHARRAELFAKANAGTASDEEVEELRKSLSPESLAETTTAPMKSDTIRKSIDVSDFLREQTNGMVSGLEKLANHIQKSEATDHGFRVAVAQTLASMSDVVREQGEMLKSIATSVGVAMNNPARGPKARVQGVQPIAKSFAGTGGAGGQAPAPGTDDGEELSKAEILKTLDDMHLNKGMTNAGGEDLLKAIAKYENANVINPKVLAEVKAHRAKMLKAAAA